MRSYDIDRLDNRNARLVENLARWLGSVVTRWHRAGVRGVARIPPGAALYVGNHNGGLVTPDTWIFAKAAYDAHGIGALPYGLGHELAISLPVFNQIVVPLGAVRARHEHAMRLFARGDKVLVYPGGDIEAFRPFRDRERIVFGGRRGYARLAIRAGVPIVPVVSAGSHEGFYIVDDLPWLARAIGAKRFLRVGVWPLALSAPWGLTLGPTPPYLPLPVRVLVEVLDPILPTRTGDAAAEDPACVDELADQVEGRMQEALTRLYAERRARRSRSAPGADA